MESLRKWFYKPKKDDTSLLAQFFYADEALNIIANELDSFDGRKDPERCTTLVNQLRQSQDKVLTITNSIMDVLIGDERANRDFRVKFPEDVLQENLAGQLWFGAECLAAGSSIMNREKESAMMRPLAKAVTKSLEHVRNLLRQACLRNNTPNGPLKLDNNELITEMLVESLKIFDKFFAEFELAYVSAMVPVKSMREYELQEMIGVMFSETLQRALKSRLLSQEMVDSYDPALMFTIPRLAIVRGLLSPDGAPLHIDRTSEEMSEMFRPFRTLLHRIRDLLWTLNKRELYQLERLLCDKEDVKRYDSGDASSFRKLKNENNVPSTSTTNPDEDSDSVISVAAATLSSILTDGGCLGSPNDSGICTETASLDRSPTLGDEKMKLTNEENSSEESCCSDSSSHSGAFEEVTAAMQAVAIATRNEVRAKYRSSEDLLHRLFVCIAGVADQLQTNFASDLRNILKAVFLINTSCETQTATSVAVSCLETSSTSSSSIEYHPSPADVVETNEFSVDPNILAQEALFDTNVYFHLGEEDDNDSDTSSYINHPRQQNEEQQTTHPSSTEHHPESLNFRITLNETVDDDGDDDEIASPPVWIPDIEAPNCMNCGANFTVVKRRHHCRYCGKIFCAKCSSNYVPLPKFGLNKPVRVCNKCFVIISFTMCE